MSSDLYLFVFNPVSKQVIDHFLPVLEELHLKFALKNCMVRQ